MTNEKLINYIETFVQNARTNNEIHICMKSLAWKIVHLVLDPDATGGAREPPAKTRRKIVRNGWFLIFEPTTKIEFDH